MQKLKMLLVIFFGITQYSFIYAQADSVKTVPKDSYLYGGLSYDHRRDLVLSFSVALTKKPDHPPMKFVFSGSYPRTSFGVGWNMYPFPEKRWIGVGVDMIYFYKTNWNIYSELFFGGNGSNTFASESGSHWRTQRFVLAPSLELRRIIAWKKLTLNVRANPLIFGFWDFTPGQGWGKWKRWYDVSVGVSYRFTLNESQCLYFYPWDFYLWVMMG